MLDFIPLCLSSSCMFNADMKIWCCLSGLVKSYCFFKYYMNFKLSPPVWWQKSVQSTDNTRVLVYSGSKSLLLLDMIYHIQWLSRSCILR